MLDSEGSDETRGKPGCLKPSYVLGPVLWPVSGEGGCSEEGGGGGGKRDKISKSQT